jgi:hypothetical protein
MSSTAFFHSNSSADKLVPSLSFVSLRPLLPFVTLSALFHILLLWNALPMTWSAVSKTSQAMTVVNIAPREPQIQEMPLAPKTRAPVKHGLRDSSAETPRTSNVVEATTTAEQSTTTRDFVVPRIDVGAIVRSAGAIAREMPIAPSRTSDLNLSVSPLSSAIAGATRNQVWTESKTGEGWVMKSGKTTCVIAPHLIPHFMQGMLIVPQCSVSK